MKDNFYSKLVFFLAILFCGFFFNCHNVLAGSTATITDYRWRNDDGSETSATWKAAANTAITGVTRGSTIRLRVTWDWSSYGGSNLSSTTALYYSTSISGTFVQVPIVATTEAFEMAPTSNYTDQSATTALLSDTTNAAFTFVAGKCVKYVSSSASNVAGSITVTSNYYTNMEFAIRATTNAVGGTTYYFKPYVNAGTETITDAHYPVLTMAPDNAAPSIGTGPSDGDSSSTTPTNVGSNVAFSATATDAQSDNYYLAICKTNSITAVNSGAPTCGGGNWCISGSAASGSQASCNYAAASGDSESNDWYAFVCDHNAGSLCSTAAQGSGTTGSPFAVNHEPSFSAISGLPSPLDPGSQITFSATSSDADASSTVTLYVCKNNTGWTGSSCGTDNEWCHSSAVASDPSCDYTIQATDGAGSKNYYAYIVDDHGFASSSNPRSSTFTINNILPTASSVSIDSGVASVVLLEGITKDVSCTATISDSNGYADITTVVAKFYRSGVGAGASDDNSNHYTLSGSKGTYCSGSGSSGTCTFTFPIYFYAEPTDAGSTYEAENWVCQVTPTDNVGAGTAATSTIEINTLKAFSVSATIEYGTVANGSNSTGDHTALVTNTGNVSTGFKVSGNNLTCSVMSYVPVGNQQYGLSGFTYGSGTVLSGTATDAGANLAKPTQSTPSVTQNTYWQVLVPGGTSGVCSGTTSFVVN